MNDHDAGFPVLTDSEREIVERLISGTKDEEALRSQCGAAEVISRLTDSSHRVDLEIDARASRRGSPEATYLVRSRSVSEPVAAVLSVGRGWLNFLEISREGGAATGDLPAASDLQVELPIPRLSTTGSSGAWSKYAPRELRDDERALLNHLLTKDFDGAAELMAQVPACKVVSEYRDDRLALELEVDRSHAPRSALLGGVPVEGEWDDGGGFPFQILLHVFHGWISELEVYSPDERRIETLPVSDSVTIR